jgi:hypothetical protein
MIYANKKCIKMREILMGDIGNLEVFDKYVGN